VATNKEIVSRAFDDWTAGTGHVSRIFAPQMTWEIVGHSLASAKYANAKEFQAKVLAPFGRRFDPADPFRPVLIRGCFAEDDTVIVIWDGAGTTTAATRYENTYAWVMKVHDGKVIDGTAFYDSISFNELWTSIIPAEG